MDVFISILRWFLKQLAKLSSSDKSSSHFEVEDKYPLRQNEFDSLPELLRRIGFRLASRVTMTDTFLPAEAKGEMIRIRDEVSLDDGRSVTILTLKRWVEVTGGERVRKETESEGLDSTVRSCILALGRRLSDGDLPSFSKERTTYSAKRDGYNVNVALDIVEGLGEYSGPYLEIEIIVNAEEEVARARTFIEGFVVELLGEMRERSISYQEMLRLSRAKA